MRPGRAEGMAGYEARIRELNLKRRDPVILRNTRRFFVGSRPGIVVALVRGWEVEDFTSAGNVILRHTTARWKGKPITTTVSPRSIEAGRF
ncbi:MAG: hypothetical protein V4449_02920 [Patescibacteria group bacterium]